MNFKWRTPSRRTVRCRPAAAGGSSQSPQRPPLPLPGARPWQPGDGAQRRRGREHPGHPLQDALLQAVHLRRVQDKRVHQGKHRVEKKTHIFMFILRELITKCTTIKITICIKMFVQKLCLFTFCESYSSVGRMWISANLSPLPGHNP